MDIHISELHQTNNIIEDEVANGMIHHIPQLTYKRAGLGGVLQEGRIGREHTDSPGKDSLIKVEIL